MKDAYKIDDGDPEFIQTKSQICMGYLQLGKEADAVQLLQEIDTLVKENMSDDDLFHNELFTMKGMIAQHKKNYQKALTYYKEGLKIAELYDDQNSIRSIISYIAVLLNRMGRLQEAKDMAIKYMVSLKEIEKRIQEDDINTAKPADV